MTIKCRLCEKPSTHIFHCDEHYHCADCGTVDDLCTYSEAVLCEKCHANRVTKRIAEFDGDTDYTAEITCPHCGHELSDSWEASDGIRECGDCGLEYEVTRDVAVTYCTTKITAAEAK